LFKDFSVHVFQQSFADNEMRSGELVNLTAEQRYLKLMNEQPDLLHLGPMRFISV
jgi:hypothetical protein